MANVWMSGRGTWRALVAGLVVVPVAAAPAQQAAATDPALEALCAALEKKRVEYHIPGMALAVVRDDTVVLARGFGVRDVEANAPVEPSTLFAIGSSTKAFTATLVGIMVDEGVMSWDEPARTHLPAFKLFDPTADAQVTVRDLLCHRVGLSRTELPWASGRASREQILAAVAKAEPVAEFRSAFNYQNCMFLAAGMAAGNADKSDWDTMVRTRIFRPLGMNATNTDVAVMQKDPRASKGYTYVKDEDRYKNLPMRSINNCAPAGAINSNVLDMSRWLRLQLGRGEFEGARIVSEKSIAETWSPQTTIAPGMSYGMGWFLRTVNGTKVVEHGGNIDGFGAQVTLYPNEHLAYVLLTNVTSTPLQGESVGIVRDALLPTPASAGGVISEAEMADYCGTYPFDVLKVDLTVSVKDGKLFVDVPGQTNYELRFPNDKGLWYFAMTEAISTSFEKNEAGKVVRMVMHQNGLDFKMAKKGVEQPADPRAMTEAQLAPYTGVYSFEEMKQKWTVKVINGRLAVDVPKQMAFVLEWPDENGRWVTQVSKDLALEFVKDAEGKVRVMRWFQGPVSSDLPLVSGPAPSDLPSIGDLMAHRAAAGKAFDALGAVRFDGKVAFINQGVDGTAVVLSAPGNRYRFDLDMGLFGSVHESTDGTRAWRDAVGSEFKELSEKERTEVLNRTLASTYADLRTLFDKVEVTAVTEKDGRRLATVKASKADGSYSTTQQIDVENGMLVKEDFVSKSDLAGAIPVSMEFSDFRDFRGVPLPYVQTISNPISGKLRITLDRVETVASVAADAFVLTPAPVK